MFGSWKQNLAETAATFTLSDLELCEENLERTLSVVQNSVDEALTKKQAEEAELKLDVYKRELNELEAEREKIQEKINKLNQAAYALGEGDLHRGAELLSQMRLKQNRLEELQRELTAIEEQGYADELKTYSPEKLQELLRKLNSLSEKNARELLRKKTLCKICPGLFLPDKPIRRFLLTVGMGRRMAFESVLLTAQTMAGKTLPVGKEISLPSRVVNAFYRWWDDRQFKSTGTNVVQGLTRARLFTELKLDQAGNLGIYFVASEV